MMKEQAGEDVDIKLKLYYETQHTSTQFSFEVEVAVGDKAIVFTRLSRDMNHALDGENALKLSLWDLWMATNKKLNNVLEEMNIIPKYDPTWWTEYTRKANEEESSS